MGASVPIASAVFLIVTNFDTLGNSTRTGLVEEVTAIDALAHGIELTWNEPTLCSPD